MDDGGYKRQLNWTYLRIDRLAHRGHGIADTPDGPFFGPLALPGGRVEGERQGER